MAADPGQKISRHGPAAPGDMLIRTNKRQRSLIQAGYRVVRRLEYGKGDAMAVRLFLRAPGFVPRTGIQHQQGEPGAEMVIDRGTIVQPVMRRQTPRRRRREIVMGSGPWRRRGSLDDDRRIQVAISKNHSQTVEFLPLAPLDEVGHFL